MNVAGYIMATLFGIGGVLSLAASVFDWEWFFSSESVRMLTWRMPRRWQRVSYAIIGICVLVMSYLIVAEIGKIGV